MKVTLLKPHEHAGDRYPPGARIDVNRETAAWLARHGVIAPLKKASEAHETAHDQVA